MTAHLLSPAVLQPGTPYHHVAVATGSRHILIAGQVASTASGDLVAVGDLEGQVSQALRNVGAGLAAAEAAFDDVVRLTIYVAGWTPDMMTPLLDGIQAVADELGLPHPMPPASLIGVEALFDPAALVEIEATAVAD